MGNVTNSGVFGWSGGVSEECTQQPIVAYDGKVINVYTPYQSGTTFLNTNPGLIPDNPYVELSHFKCGNGYVIYSDFTAASAGYSISDMNISENGIDIGNLVSNFKDSFSLDVTGIPEQNSQHFDITTKVYNNRPVYRSRGTSGVKCFYSSVSSSWVIGEYESGSEVVQLKNSGLAPNFGPYVVMESTNFLGFSVNAQAEVVASESLTLANFSSPHELANGVYTSSGTLNGRNVYIRHSEVGDYETANVELAPYSIYWDGSSWVLTNSLHNKDVAYITAGAGDAPCGLFGAPQVGFDSDLSNDSLLPCTCWDYGFDPVTIIEGVDWPEQEFTDAQGRTHTLTMPAGKDGKFAHNIDSTGTIYTSGAGSVVTFKLNGNLYGFLDLTGLLIGDGATFYHEINNECYIGIADTSVVHSDGSTLIDFQLK